MQLFWQRFICNYTLTWLEKHTIAHVYLLLQIRVLSFPAADCLYQITSCDQGHRHQSLSERGLISAEALEQIREQEVFIGKVAE